MWGEPSSGGKGSAGNRVVSAHADDVCVPEISRFFGIVIRMFYREHEPAHFHAEHQGQQGKFDEVFP